MNWFEDKDQYVRKVGLPHEFYAVAGPKSVALVDVYDEGRTTPGWGLAPARGRGFMHNYHADKFAPRNRAGLWETHGRPFAIVMRSVAMIAVDLDRHDQPDAPDGFVAASKLGLPPTLAQTSKSGAGRHLFYLVPGEQWDETTGFAQFEDVIGLAPGVDVRAVGCIYRYDTQRWNNIPVAPAPDSLLDLLRERTHRKAVTRTRLAAVAAAPLDSEEAMIMHDSLIQDLNKPITSGSRNMTLFAIGSQMMQANVPDWQDLITNRALDVGLSLQEANELPTKIQRYGLTFINEQKAVVP